jgi:hypothetical protein
VFLEMRTMMLTTHRIAAITVLVAVVGLMTGADAAASTITIGDVDGFGFTTAFQFRATPSPHTTPADTNGDGMLTAGEFLPDLNRDGVVGPDSGDTFDQRSLSEIVATNGAQNTDRSLSPAGAANGLSFLFTFVAPSLGDFDFGVDRTLNFVFGDYDVSPATLSVDGAAHPLNLQSGGQDGLIQLLAVNVPFTDLIDGQVLVSIIAPTESYLVVDYVELVGPDAATPVPEPASMILMLLGGSGIFLRSRHRAYRVLSR